MGKSGLRRPGDQVAFGNKMGASEDIDIANP
jgi:hypothetical protein